MSNRYINSSNQERLICLRASVFATENEIYRWKLKIEIKSFWVAIQFATWIQSQCCKMVQTKTKTFQDPLLCNGNLESPLGPHGLAAYRHEADDSQLDRYIKRQISKHYTGSKVLPLNLSKQDKSVEWDESRGENKSLFLDARGLDFAGIRAGVENIYVHEHVLYNKEELWRLFRRIVLRTNIEVFRIRS